MGEQIACRCGNAVYAPPPGREYACPVCRRRLPRRGESADPSLWWTERVARGSLGVGCLATIFAVVWYMIAPLRSPTVAYATGRGGRRAPYRPFEEQRYRMRVRQLEHDLRLDPRNFGLLVKLGGIHLRLGLRQPDPTGRGDELEQAQALFRRATFPGVALTRREFEYASVQLDRLAGRFPIEDALLEPLPTSDPLGGSVLPFPAVDAELILYTRRQYLRVRLAELPNHPRLLCRLGWTTLRLAQASRQRRATGDNRGFYELTGDQPEALLTEAADALRRAARFSPAREYRAEAYQGLAEISLMQQRRDDAVAFLRKVLTLQPNNWPAGYRLAALLRQMRRQDAAQRALTASLSWRTPEWL